MYPNKFVFAFLFLIAPAAVSQAATIYLRDNTQIKGTVVSATARDIQVHTDSGTVTLTTDRIDRIQYADTESPPVSAAPAATYVPPEPPRARFYGWPSDGPLRQAVSLGLGAAIPLSRVNFSPTGGGTDTNGSVGLMVSGRYFYNFLPRLSIGPDISFFHRGHSESQSLLPSTNTDVFGNTLLLLVNGKFALVDDGPIRPYLLGGVGGNRTSTIAEATPNPGFGWSDTNTFETRTLVDDAHWGFASQAAFGIDFPMVESSLFGLEFAWVYLDNSTYGATSAGQDVGLTSLTGSQHFFTVTGRWSWRLP